MRILTTDFVTNVDLTVHNTLRGQLFQLAPAVQFLGEEAGGRVTTPAARPSPFWRAAACWPPTDSSTPPSWTH